MVDAPNALMQAAHSSVLSTRRDRTAASRLPVERIRSLEALTAQIKAATTIAAVEAVTWTFP
jgi:hypothetical protein